MSSRNESLSSKFVFQGSDLPRRRDLAAHPGEVRATRQRDPLDDGMNERTNSQIKHNVRI